MNKPTLDRCYRLFDCGYSLITVGENKRPNYAWKPCQNKPLEKAAFEKQYQYAGGYIKKDGEEMQATVGVGLVCGFNGLEVIDVDLKVFNSLPEQQAFWNELYAYLTDNIDDFDRKFVVVKTRNQGYHILYRCEFVAGNTKIAKLKGHTEAVIESRGVGGYVFIYDNQISQLGYNDVQEITKQDREILWNICATFNYIDESRPIETERPIKQYEKSDVTPWQDFNDKTDIFDIIGPDFDIVRQLSDKYIIRRHGATSPHSGYVYKNSGCMYLFSTGTIYPHEKLISPFSAYAYKHHNGDFSRAASQLYKDGFGSRTKEIKVPELKTEIEDLSEVAFPLDVFPAPIQEYMIQCNKYLNHSFDYMGASMLWMLSVIVGNSMRIKVKTGWSEIATVWISVVGQAGIGKTPSIDSIIFPLLKQNSREVKRYIKALKKFEEYSKLTKDEKQYTEEAKEPTKSQFIANDITLEALVELHGESKVSVGVFKDELNGWFKDMNKYRAGSDLEFWLSTWSGKSVAFNRKMAKSAFVDLPIIPVLGGIQPGVLASMYTEENKENGFVDRMLLTFPELRVDEYNENEIDPVTVQWYEEAVVSMYEIVREKLVEYDLEGEVVPMLCNWSQEAKREWIRIFNKITHQQNSDEINEYAKSGLPKMKSYIPRFSLLLHFLNASVTETDVNIREVSKQAVLGAERLAEYFTSMSRKIRSTSRDEAQIKEVSKSNQGRTPFEIFEAMYRKNPKIKTASVASQLEVSRQTVYNWKKELDKM
jgi:hypothetical protein